MTKMNLRILSTVIGAITLVPIACGKRVSGPSNVESRTLAEGDLEPGQVGSAGGSSVDQLNQELADLRTQLQQQIDKEKSDRAAGDEDLRQQIIALEARITALEAKLAEEIARLDAAIAAEAKSRSDAIEVVNGDIAKLRGDVTQELASAVNDIKIERAADLEKLYEQLTDEYTAAVSAAMPNTTCTDIDNTQQTCAKVATDRAAALKLRRAEQQKAAPVQAELDRLDALVSQYNQILDDGVENFIASERNDVNAKLVAQYKKITDDNAVAFQSLLPNDVMCNTAADGAPEVLVSCKTIVADRALALAANNQSEVVRLSLILAKGVQAHDDLLAHEVTNLQAEIDKLKAKDIELSDDIQKQVDALEALKDVVTDAQNDINGLRDDLTDTRNDLQASIDSTQADLDIAEQAIIDLNGDTEMNADAIELLKRRQLILAFRLVRLEREQAEFEREVAATYATKAELKGVQNTLITIQDSITLLRGDFSSQADLIATIRNELDTLKDETIEALVERIEGIEGDITELRTDLNGLTATVSDIEGRLTDHIKDYEKHVEEFGNSCEEAIAKLREEIAANRGYTDGAINTLRSEIVLRLAEFKTSEEIDALLGAKVEELKAYANAAAGSAEQTAILEAERLFNIAQNDRQAMEAQIQGQLDAVMAAIEAVEAKSKMALDLAQANAAKIKWLSDTQASLLDRVDGLEGELTKLNAKVDSNYQELKQYADSVAESLNSDLQEQFAAINIQLADLSTKVENASTTIVNIIFNIIGGDLVLIQEFTVAQHEVNIESTNKLYEYQVAQNRLEEAFIKAVDPVMESKGVDMESLNQSFSAIVGQSECNGFPAPGDGQFSALGDKEYFFHLARYYTNLLVSSPRSANWKEVIFLAKPVLVVSNEELASLSILGSAALFSARSDQVCHQNVMAWAADAIMGNGANAKKLRDALVASADFRAAVVDLYSKAAQLKTPMTELTSIIKDILTKKLGNANDVDDALYGDGDGDADETASILAQVAALLLDNAGEAAELDQIRANRERFINLARDMVELKNGTAAALNAFDNRVTQLNNQLRACINVIKDQLNGVIDAQKTAFNLIATIASRLGFEDIIDAAEEATEKIGGEIEILQPLPPTCMSAQHFYNHISNRAIAGTRCESNLTLAGQQLGFYPMSKCAVHGAWGTYNNASALTAYTWGNRSQVGNGWNAINQNAGNGHIVTNGLQLKVNRAPNDAEAQRLKNLPKGSSWAQQNGESAFVLRLIGAASKWKINVANFNGANRAGYANDTVNLVLDAEAKDAAGKFLYKVGSDGNNANVYEIPLNQAITRLGGCRWDRSITIQALDADGKVAGDSCKHNFHTFSPIVLDLAAKGMVETVNPINSQVLFDLDANGRLQSTGWIQRGAGFLAIDLNGNGRIDDGSELFGEATKTKEGFKAQHGYAAMTQYDDNKDGRLDSKDSVWSKLVVWQDANMDGRSQGYELSSLTSLNISAMGVGYTNVSSDKMIQDHGGLPEGNLVKYEGRYWGPEACGEAGCKSFDVFFGNTESFVVGKN